MSRNKRLSVSQLVRFGVVTLVCVRNTTRSVSLGALCDESSAMSFVIDRRLYRSYKLA